ncbi:expansin-B3 [Cryptomeria japonica]|uniref:expansin-B3 n=1 Tax=Cryptomeria japonica TaxID=3369 RepID=UPI0025AD79B0|nr:expansin-B3 [Cryptomeria japonica]
MAACMGKVVIMGLIVACIDVVLGFQAMYNLAEAADWQQATATWYGSPDGDGSEGGACGYGSLVKATPFASRVTAVSPDLFKGGEGCGECYQVKCEENSLCSDTPVTVVVTDECPGCSSNHFDLSGTAFSGMAVNPAQASGLRNAGVLPIFYKRVPCEYPGKKVTFHVNEGSTDHWFSVLIEYENGDGDLQEVDLQQNNSTVWEGLKQTWGANWCLNEGPLKAPFSIRLKSLSSGSTLTAYNVIPQNWQPDAVYTSIVNYD